MCGEWFQTTEDIRHVLRQDEIGVGIIKSAEITVEALRRGEPLARKYYDIAELVLDGEEWLTIAMAAQRIGLTVAAVYKAIERERLEVRVILDLQTVAASDVARLWPQPEPVAEL